MCLTHMVVCKYVKPGLFLCVCHHHGGVHTVWITQGYSYVCVRMVVCKYEWRLGYSYCASPPWWWHTHRNNPAFIPMCVSHHGGLTHIGMNPAFIHTVCTRMVVTHSMNNPAFTYLCTRHGGDTHIWITQPYSYVCVTTILTHTVCE